jgi:hypothetical protein
MRSTRWPRGAVRGASSTLRWAGGCFATAAALTLTGCVPTPAEPAVTPSASASSSAPVFASDEEALAAARSTYERFVSTIDTVIAENGANPERIDELAVPALAEEEKQGIDGFVANGLRMTGRAQVTKAVFQSRSVNIDDTTVVTIYVCMDVAEIEILDSKGTSKVETTRPDRTALEVTLHSQGNEPTELLVASKSPWNGDGVC